MTDTTSYLCIGPVVLDNAHLVDESSYQYDNSASETITAGGTIYQRGAYSEKQSFKIITSVDKALQLKGVVEQGEIVWMNTADTTDNDYLQHKGYVLITSLSISEENMTLCTCSIEYIKISDKSEEFLTLDYSRGNFDGVNITPSYTVLNTATLINESGASTTNWSAVRLGYEKRATPTTKTFASDGSEFDMTLQCAASSSYGSVYNYIWTTYKDGFALPCTITYDMDYNTLATATTLKSMGVGISSYNYENMNIYFDNKRAQFFETYFDITNGAKYGVRTRRGNSATSNLKGPTSFTSANQTVRFKCEFDANAKVRISVDVGVTGSYTQIYYGASGLTAYSNGVILYLWVANKDTSAWTGSFRNITVTRDYAPSFPNIVLSPPGAVLTNLNTTGSRTLEDGTSYYYVNPTTEIPYTIAATDYYKGSVKLLSTNNDDNASIQAFSTEHKLTPTTTKLKNGMTQLVFNANGFDIQAYYSGAWNTINTIVYPSEIKYLKPIYINSERVVLQVEQTKITMLRSSPLVTIEHPTTALTYTRKDRYTTGSGTTSSPAAGATIAMTADTDYWMSVYNNAALDYKLLFVKKDPCNIKSDSLPADTITGVGWFENAGTDYETGINIALSWYKQTRTGISLKQIV